MSSLDEWEESWNKRIDKEVTILGNGLGKIIAQPAESATSQLALQIQSQTLVQSAESLLALTHQLKLLVLLSEPQKPAAEAEQIELQEEIRKTTERLAQLMK
jgi:hypothetical protein